MDEESYHFFPVSPGVNFNVDKAKRIINGRKPNARASVAKYHRFIVRGFATTTAKRIIPRLVNPDPVILVSVGSVETLVDGWHRIKYAKRIGRKTLSAHRLTQKEFELCTFPA